MSSAVDLEPPPPPPARPFSTHPAAALPPTSASPPAVVAFASDEHRWAAAHPDVHKACFLARVCAHQPPAACRLLDIPPILQEGPTCGLTAVAMLTLGRAEPEHLLAVARQRGFTRNGEMFSAAALAALVRDQLDDDAAARVWLHEGDLVASSPAGAAEGSDRIQQVLRQGGCLLVPYDADFNHGPCLRSGHRAHWALIIGYLIDEEDRFHVLARHGKTKNIAVWPLAELGQSNANLTEFGQPKGHPDVAFVLPAGGVGGALGLRRRCVVIEGVRAPQIVIR